MFCAFAKYRKEQAGWQDCLRGVPNAAYAMFAAQFHHRRTGVGLF